MMKRPCSKVQLALILIEMVNMWMAINGSPLVIANCRLFSTAVECIGVGNVSSFSLENYTDTDNTRTSFILTQWVFGERRQTTMHHLPAHAFKGLNFTIVTLRSVRLMSIHPKAFEDIQTTLLHLTLSYNLLDKVPVQSLSLLSELQILDLGRNRISYLESKSFQNMTHLTDIDLFDNIITTIMEDAFQGPLYLDMLSLGQNPLSSESITFSVPKVNFLSLYRCEVDNVSQPLFQSNADIQTLTLSESNLAVLAPTAFSNMANTRSLSLNKNYLTGNYICSSVDWQTLPSLRMLDLNENNITTVFSECFGGLTSLVHLRLSRSKISQLESDAFMGLASLENLRLNENHIRTVQNGSFYGLTNLSELDLEANQIKKLSPGAFLSLVKLNVLLLQGNSLGASDICNSVWRPLINLRTLNLAQNEITTLSPSCFSSIGPILSLYLDRNNISELEMQIFSGLHNLQTLQLSSNRLKVITNVTFSGLPSLQHLFLQHNRIITIQKNSFALLKLLKGIHLQNNRLTTLGVLQINSDMNCLIALNQNPLYCNCNLSWMISKNITLSRFTRCKHPAVKGKIDLKEFLLQNCKDTSSNMTLVDHQHIQLVTFNSLMSVLAFVIAVIVFVFICICKHLIKNMSSGSTSQSQNSDNNHQSNV